MSPLLCHRYYVAVIILNMPMPSPFVSVDWLHSHLDDSICIIDCRFALSDPDLGQRQYEAGHIPGAHYLSLDRDLSSPVQTHGGRHPLPAVDVLVQTLEQLGISSNPPQDPPTTVVAYDDSRFAFAARLWWLLRYLGHDQVFVLDGGWQGWQAKGYPISTEVPQPQAGQFIPQIQPEQVVGIEQVKARQEQPGTVLIDSRAAERYRGEQEPIDPIAGHIPGAVNYPWQQVTDEQSQVRSRSELQQHWQDIQSAEEVIVYCGSGVTACVNLLGMAAAGLQGRLYAGSWSDWCSYLDPEDLDSTAIATGDEPTR
jgi:thiosulfate/3-mercaptopyruvate sulfurtransferase